MEYITLPGTDQEISRLGLGCMRIWEKDVGQVESLVQTALEKGINFFDHADIYGGGACEELFGRVLKRNPGLREKMLIQTKCDIVPASAGGPRYDASMEHILSCVDNSLERLQCGYLDVLLLHRPDALADPCEVAEAFDRLYRAGKVRHFGVSNHSAGRIALLQKYVNQPLIIDQMQFSVVHSCMVDAGIFADMTEPQAIDRDGGVIDYCMLHGLLIQPWCPLQASWAEGSFIGHPHYSKLNDALDKLAGEYGVTKAAVALAWILRHPAYMQPILGTTSIQHLKEACAATAIQLTRQQWYDLYLAEGKPLP